MQLNIEIEHRITLQIEIVAQKGQKFCIDQEEVNLKHVRVIRRGGHGCLLGDKSGRKQTSSFRITFYLSFLSQIDAG